MKKILFIMVFMPFICNSANAQDSNYSDYYWYGDSIIELQRGNQQYIIYEDDFLQESDKEQLVNNGEVFYPEYTNLKWGTTHPDAIIEDLELLLLR